ncbi:MAG TPA: MATE family efflux transporter [Thiotrichaceae bacterium]|jgi:MATE family multidrug resistance protein|nr:MATE family efflux transporter [Thiotrichaceae bacterium]HIM06963.1 MATE family efflux transporter [Gammaproteobacteria bacterium]
MMDKSQHRAFWLLAGPMIIGNISMALLGLVDTAVIGHLDTAVYLGGVAVGTIIFDFLYWGMGFLRMGTTGIVAQAHGKNDATEVRTILMQSILVGLGIAFIFLLFQKPVFNIGLSFLEGSSEVKHYALVYCQWLIWGMPALMILFSVNGWLLGMQNAMAVLRIGIVVNVINIILDVVFVVYMDMDVRGVALATVISQYSGVLMAFIVINKQLSVQPSGQYGEWSLEKILNIKKLRNFLSLNHDIFIRTICLIFVFAFFTREGAKQGDLVLAANSILLKFYLLMALALDGFNHAAEALVGKAIGQKNKNMFNQAVSLTLKWSFVFGMCFTLFYWLLGEGMINLLTNIEPVREVALLYLPWMVVLPLISVWCFLLDGIFIGATRGPEMRNSMLICTFVFFLPLWYVFQYLGNHGLWLAFTLFIAIRGVTLGIYYYLIERNQGFISI